MNLKRLLHDAGRIANLAWPIWIGQLAIVSNAVIDTAMTSRFSTVDLAAFSISVAIYMSIFVGLNGILQALSPSIGQLFGAQQYQEIGREVKQGIWLGIFLSLVGGLILIFPQHFIAFAQGSDELTQKATAYLHVVILALPATLGFRIYSALNNAVGKPKMVMAIQVASILIKFPLNYLFIFGGWGIPAMGGVGCAVSTAILAWLMMAGGWLTLKHAPHYQQYGLFGTGFQAPDWKAITKLLKLGIPMGLSYLIEVTAFTMMALFIARLGNAAVSGHQITANLVTVLYMLPMAIAIATCTLTAQSIGAAQYTQAKQVGNAGLLLAASTAFPISVGIWLARDTILHAYTSNEVIITSALPLFLFVPVYHFFDALQVTLAFILRAYKIAMMPTVIYAIALWGIGIGGGYMLGLGKESQAFVGAQGFWLASSAANAAVALGLFVYLRSRQKSLQRP